VSNESVGSEESGSDIGSGAQTLLTSQDSDSDLSGVDIDLTAIDPILLDEEDRIRLWGKNWINFEDENLIR
jgi:hypothetical protein